MAQQLDYYAILEVSPDADEKAIKAAYRRLAAKFHPDVNPSPEAAERMKLINEAYRVLRNPAWRLSYDQHRGDLVTGLGPRREGAADEIDIVVTPATEAQSRQRRTFAGTIVTRKRPLRGIRGIYANLTVYPFPPGTEPGQNLTAPYLKIRQREEIETPFPLSEAVAFPTDSLYISCQCQWADPTPAPLEVVFLCRYKGQLINRYEWFAAEPLQMLYYELTRAEDAPPFPAGTWQIRLLLNQYGAGKQTLVALPREALEGGAAWRVWARLAGRFK
ncbi:MAG TPA: hypothetical protein EYP85_04120 [Armatimonadetes bacterium]|nr:hypothetical protein [Armatimonadota bacterium]